MPAAPSPPRVPVLERLAPSRGAPLWVSGLLAGVQAALLSMLVVVMPALAAYVATSADPSNVEIGWPRAVAVGSVVWLLGHGATVEAGGTAVTLVPLGITGLAVFAAWASARRSSHRTVPAWLGGIAGYLLVIAAVTVLAGASGPLGAGPGAVVRLGLGTVAIAALGLGLGVVRRARLRARTERWWGRIPAPVRAGAVAGTVAVAALTGAAALLTVVWAVSGRAATGDVIEGLGVDTFGGLLLAVAQLAVAPNLVTWALAWLAGPGFSVGAGSLYAPAAVVGGPVPALPLLGALPTDAGGLLLWVPVGLVVPGMLAGAWLRRRVVTRAAEPLVSVGCAALTAGVLAAVLIGLGSGAVGPGRLAVIGGSAAAVGAMVLAGTLVGAMLVAVPTDPVVRAALAAGWARGRDRVRGRADLDLSADGGEAGAR